MGRTARCQPDGLYKAARRAFSSRLFVTDGDAAVEVVNDYPGAIPL
jgi:hypothetical protein